MNTVHDDEGTSRSTANGTAIDKASDVPLGVAVDDRPATKPSRAATNNREDRTRAFLLIGGILSGVLLLVLLGNTVLRPMIVNQRQATLERITSDQVQLLATIAEAYYVTEGTMPTAVSELLDDERMETSDGRDLWGTPFGIRTEPLDAGMGTRLILTSAGPDQEFGTNDDLSAERVLGVPAQAEVD